MKQYPQHMKMSELSARTKISVNTIRNYARRGLLPEPIKTGKTMAYYTAEHIDRLKKIHALQKKGNSLDQIRRAVNKNAAHTDSGQKPETLYTTKRNTIVKAAVDLFQDKGYETTNIDDVVAYAGIGKTTFYQYFKNMEKLFFACTQHVFFDITRYYSAADEEDGGLKRLWYRGHTFMHTHLHIIDMLNLARGAFMKDSNHLGKKLEEDIFHDFIRPIEADLILASQKENIHFKDLRLLAHLLIGGLEYAYYYLQIHPEANMDIVYRQCWDMIFNVNGHYNPGPEVSELMSYPAAIAACAEKLTISEMNEKDLMKISELSMRSGIPISTIRYYLLEGLLPAAMKTGKTRAYYSSIHLKALNLIRHKQVDEKKPLDVIRTEIKKEISLPQNRVKQADLPYDKRDAILSVSAALFLKRGYIETNTTDIANNAKMSKETVYKHFKNKEEIFMACADRIFHDMYNQIANEIRDERDAALMLIKRAKVFFSFYPQWISMMNLVRGLSVGDNPAYRSKFHQLIGQMASPTIREIETLQKEGRIRKDINSDLAGFIITGMSEYGAWLIHHKYYSDVAIMESLTSILYEGVIVSPLSGNPVFTPPEVSADKGISCRQKMAKQPVHQ